MAIISIIIISEANMFPFSQSFICLAHLFSSTHIVSDSVPPSIHYPLHHMSFDIKCIPSQNSTMSLVMGAFYALIAYSFHPLGWKFFNMHINFKPVEKLLSTTRIIIGRTVGW